MISYYSEDPHIIISEYLTFLKNEQVSKRGQNILDLLKDLFENPLSANEQECLNLLNELYSRFFENMKGQGRLLVFKQDYLS